MTRPIPVLVTEAEYNRARAVFDAADGFACIAAPADEPSLAEEIRRTGVHDVVIGHRPYRGLLYETLPPGGVIARFGVGHDNVDKGLATSRRLLCTNSPGVLDQSVAEFTMLLVGAASRHFGAMDADFRGGRWKPRQGIELAGKTLAVIGLGRIGLAVARIACRGFGIRVIGCRRSAGETTADVALVTPDFAAAVRDADFVSLHVPSSASTRHFMSADRFAMMPAKAWFINTARGAVVDEAAMFDALAEGRIAGAALDVFEREPYQPVDPARDLRTLPNVLLTPHAGSATPEANRAMAERALRNIRLAHDKAFGAMDLLNPEVLGA